jgi:uncharacterized protein (TIGR03437 family)
MKLQSIMLALAAVIPAAAQTSVTFTYTYNGSALPIYRDSADIISVANLFVPNALRVTKITATVDIEYPRPGDLNVYLYSPILTRTKLIERNCGSQGTVQNITFDDAAATRYSDTCPSASGSYRANEPLSNFNDQVAFGIWSLAVENNGSDDFVGYLRGFSIAITGVAVTTKPITAASAVVNAASMQAGAIAPGELIQIGGFNLGPLPALSAPAGDLPLTLGGVQVTFDGTPGAVSYVSAYVVAVQAPVGLQAGKQTEMRVTYQNATSDPVLLDVWNAAPGVYTLSAIGVGRSKAWNADGTMNSAARPAAKGQMVTLYASGLGAVTPALTTGKMPPASPTSIASWPVTAVVDGLTADVAFAGAAPGFPGVYQVNVKIPLDAGTGARWLTLFAAGAPSQTGVWVYVQ